MPYDPERHGPRRIVGEGFHEQVYAVVAAIPRGRVATYGDVAGALGSRSVARQVGFDVVAFTGIPGGAAYRPCCTKGCCMRSPSIFADHNSRPRQPIRV